MPERFDFIKYQRLFFKRAAATVAVMASLIIGGVMLTPPAALDLGKILASQEIAKRGMQKFDKGVRQLQQEMTDYKAGKISEYDADVRGRTIMAPVFRDIAADLSQVTLHPNDLRRPIVQDAMRMSELLAEQFAMESVLNETTRKYDPIDPIRSGRIEAELKQIIERIAAYTKNTNSKKQ